MTVKLSPQKVSKMLRMYFHGFTQTAIAKKLGVNQATVWLYVNEFTAMVELEGLETAAKEHGIMNIVKEFHSLGAECQKSGLTIAEAKKALKMAVVLEECGVHEDEFLDAVQTFIQLKKDGFLEAAVELKIIEDGSGKSFYEIMEEGANAETQKQQAWKELEAI